MVTDAMIEAGAKAYAAAWGSGTSNRKRAEHIYAAMEAARPTADLGEDGKGRAREILASDLGLLTDAFDRLDADEQLDVVERLAAVMFGGG